MTAVGVEPKTSGNNAAIRPFRVEIRDDALDDLRRRIANARLPGRELVTDRSQGVQLATIQALSRYWLNDYDWRMCEARLNALPQYKTEIDGADIHFIHVKSRHENALPLVVTHGWPGSIIEMLEIVGPLTDPTAHGGQAEDAFHLVLPSLPGYGFSAAPPELGWDAARFAQAWGKLMPRLGYTHYVAQGGDRGRCHRRDGPPGARRADRHPHEPVRAGVRALPDEHRGGTRGRRAGCRLQETGFGYFIEQATRPQTIGYALLDSPIGLAAWMLDHDTDSYYKISSALIDGKPSGNLTRGHIVDNITLYWLTGTGASAARWYWETDRPPLARPDRLSRQSRSRSDSPVPGEASGPRAAGSSRPTPPSPTSTKSTKAGTSPPGRSPSCTRPRSAPRSSRSGRSAEPVAPFERRRPTASVASRKACKQLGGGRAPEVVLLIWRRTDHDAAVAHRRLIRRRERGWRNP